jgi:broad specificity phosphatase PhoE
MGHEPEPLSPSGRADVEVLARWLSAQAPFAALVTSQMERARETCEAIASVLGQDYAFEPALNEPAFDGWVGKSIEHLRRDDERFRRYVQDPTDVHVEGELTLRSLVARAVRAVHRLALEHGEQSVLAVSHGDIIRGIIAAYVGIALDGLWHLGIDPASVSVLELAPSGSGRLLLMNWVPAAPGLDQKRVTPEFRSGIEPSPSLPSPPTA